MRPLVAIECDHVDGRRDYFKAYAAYVDAVWRAGGTPLLLPAVLDEGYVAEVLRRIDALVLTGGDDIDAAEFGQTLHPEATLVTERRYGFGKRLVEPALARGVPCLGVCYGMQLLNVLRGGDIIQHIPDALPGAIAHIEREADGSRRLLRHPITVAEGSRLGAIVGAAQVEINSMHHQAVGRLGRGLLASATASDGVVEAIELAEGPLFLGVQWHPERLEGPAGQGLFEALVEAARERVGASEALCSEPGGTPAGGLDRAGRA